MDRPHQNNTLIPFWTDFMYRHVGVQISTIFHLVKICREVASETIFREKLDRDSEHQLLKTCHSAFDLFELDMCATCSGDLNGKHDDDLSLFQSLINQSNDAIFIIAPKTGEILYVNDKACSNLRRSRDEMLAMHVRDYAVNIFTDDDWHRLVETARSNSFAIFETEQRRKDGTTFPVEVNVRYAILDQHHYMISVARDITERNQAKERILEEKNKLEAVIAAIADGITLQDRDFRVIYQNANHRERQGSHLGEYCYRAYQHRDDICPGCLLVKAFEDGMVHRRETTAPTGSGEIFLEVTASPVQDAHGRIIAGIEVVRDITVRKKMEAEMLKNQKLESLGVLAGGIAHDFNNLLTSILGSVSMVILERNPSESSHELLLETEKAALRARDLTRQLLTFSRGGLPVKKHASIRELAEETTTFTLRGSNVKPQFIFEPALLPTEVDAGQIGQVITNLVLNAMQAMPNGGVVQVSVSNATVFGKTIPLPPGEYVMITVSDHGVGIAMEELGKIFDPYYTTKPTGSGLGLATCYSIIRHHEGHITVESEPGKGSSFHVYLPATMQKPDETAEAAIDAKPLTGRILFMDDDEGVRYIAERFLTKLGCQVVLARHGAEAIELYRQAHGSASPFCAVIMDLTVSGGMGGKEACRYLKEIDPSVKAFVASGYSNDQVMADYGAFGFTGVIPKPFTMEQMAAELKKACS
jgi:PAS domain S-box-containing protein